MLLYNNNLKDDVIYCFMCIYFIQELELCLVFFCSLQIQFSGNFFNDCGLRKNLFNSFQDVGGMNMVNLCLGRR